MAPPRKIIHVDADAFYASVEIRENPALAGLPLAVGGSPEGRGVIATASYEARRFGVRSAMASARALRLCPELRIIRPRFELYREVSASMRAIFRDYSAVIEPLSLDEAYLDVSDCPRCGGSATLVASEIRQRVRSELGITVSAGVAPNKFLAKIASDWNKPDGQFTVPPDRVAAFVHELPVERISGVGRVTARKLAALGVATCGDLQRVPAAELVKRFGRYGTRLRDLARGVDEREVQASRLRKSISVERTFPEDLRESPVVQAALQRIIDELCCRFGRIADRYVPVGRFVKLKFSDFTQTTRESALRSGGEDWSVPGPFRELLAAAAGDDGKAVRLLGAGLRLQPRRASGCRQLALFGPGGPGAAQSS